MRHSTLHSISRQQNKYIALKNHQNTISFGVVFMSWHTKEKVSLKRDYFQWWVGTVHQKEKRKCFIFTRFEINIQFICTNLSNQLRLHVSEGQRNKQVNTFWLFLNKTDEIELLAHLWHARRQNSYVHFFTATRLKMMRKSNQDMYSVCVISSLLRSCVNHTWIDMKTQNWITKRWFSLDFVNYCVLFKKSDFPLWWDVVFSIVQHVLKITIFYKTQQNCTERCTEIKEVTLEFRP